ncbi:hypothetical protein I305_02948 [Cryptococcus gattii E566]|nr:hypothetical protein I305_02948 [Cryptococcus gattii E566]
MADDIRSWITKALIDHDKAHGANFRVPVNCKHYCQLLKFYTYRDHRNPRAQIEGSIGDRTHCVKAIFDIEETDKFELPDPDTGYKHSLTSQLRSIFQIKQFQIRIAPPPPWAGAKIPLVAFYVTKWDVVSGNHDEPVYWLDTCKVGEGNNDGKIREVLQKWWFGESNSEASQNRSSQKIPSQDNIPDMSITTARPRVKNDVAYHRRTVALGDIISIEEAKASRVGEWDPRFALAWLERNQDTVLNTYAQYRNYSSNNIETIDSPQRFQNKTVLNEPSGNGHPPKSQPVDVVRGDSESPHLFNKRSPSSSPQSHHASSPTSLRVSPSKRQLLRKKIIDPLNFPSSPATSMSRGSTDEELLSQYEREERRKRGESKGIKGDGDKELEQRSPSSSQLSQSSLVFHSSPTMATPRRLEGELSQTDRPSPELSSAQNATISNARDKWKRSRESMNSRRQSRVVILDEDEDIGEGPLIKKGSKRKLILSSPEPASQVIEIRDSSDDEENVAEISSSLTTQGGARDDDEHTVKALQDLMPRTKELKTGMKWKIREKGKEGMG